MTDEDYLKARGWVLMREKERGMVAACRNRLNFVPVAEAVETQIAEDRAVAGYLAARGVHSGHLIAVSSFGGVASSGSGSAVVSCGGGGSSGDSHYVAVTGRGALAGAPPGLTRVVPEAFVEAAKTLASVVLQATREPVSVPWSDVQKAAETVDTLDRKPR